ncbi:cytochrome C biogenesis protein [Xanthomonas translucens pv. arrhenatheri]|uniref:Cytochrome c-type biogenesis protein n=1 Tax=Xanthomonas graminis pv. arrhenatheri LMG 727 TaxID=1195923 RepID=A0A0K2ZF64_9XANT|nr:cytochrome c-type biogenesis protein [Xanthomonas translucens]OAX65207.1 cytochrome C biogenesis protein [Xanthomonas translucens pv. arrhenatheri]UKE79567.1 cytochrome c-type biogenesis protein CcmH [Xanthomonas translucens pv. arrhenatheri]CTP84371.1 cytochrome C biogenesis protein ccmh [Xanthomonas translucens pv. arrhenatheri LMG 727]
MRRWRALLLVLLACAGHAGAQPVADTTPLAYRSAAEEARFHALTAELRCVQCQNQSLADSHAQIALDLRREVLQLMQQGRSDAEIKRFLVDRYGEFVLYRPQLEARTWLLWFGPLALLGAGALLVVWVVRRRAPAGAAPPAQEEQEW